jgi:hypothetical protein
LQLRNRAPVYLIDVAPRRLCCRTCGAWHNRSSGEL